MKNETLRVLLVEDDEDDYVLTRSLLAEADGVHFVLAWADTYEKAIECLSPGAYEACLVDYRLGARDGLELLQEAREKGLTAPLIILTGQGDKTLGLRAIKAGADDYLVKAELNTHLLTRTIRYAVERRQAVEALHRSEALRRLAVEGAELGTWSYDLQQEDLFWDERAREIFGFGAEEPLTLERALGIIHPDDREQTLQALEEATDPDSSVSYEIEKRILWPDGTVRWVATKGQVRFSRVGSERKAVQMAGVVMDVTERKRAEEEIRQQSERADALARAAAGLNMQLETNAVLDAVCEETRDAFKASAASIMLYDAGPQSFQLAAALGFPTGFHEQIRPVPLSLYETITGESGPVALQLNPDVASEMVNGALFSKMRVRTLLTVSLQRDEQPLGLLTVYALEEERVFTKNEMELLQGLADQAAQAITNAQLYEQAKRRLRRLEGLHAIDRAITGMAPLPEVLDVVVEQTVQLLQVDAATVLLLNEEKERLEPAADRGFNSCADKDVPIELGEGYAGSGAARQEIVSVPDVRQVDDFVRAGLVREEGFVTYYGAPLVAQGELKGVLSVFHRSLLEPDDEWVQFLKALALQAAIAIERAQLFARLQEEVRRVQEIMDTIPEGVLLTSGDGRVLRANPAARQYLPLLADAQVEGALGEAGAQRLVPLLNGVPDGPEWYELRAERHGRIFEAAAQPLSSTNGEGERVIVLRDVTEERERLQHILSQERLATVGQLAAGIAHDFNNIMAVITLYSAGLLKNPDMPKRRHYLHTINEQAHHASNLIGQILDFSRASIMEPQQLNLLPFIKEVMNLLKRTLPESIDIELRADAEAFPVSADSTRLQQVLMNLAVNARDAMPAGGALRLSLGKEAVAEEDRAPLLGMAPGEWIRLEVSDTGCGISREALPHIFEPFFTTKEGGRGTGLGLAQVYGIVKQHGGEIDVSSRPGAGTTFILFLPEMTEGEKRDPAVETGTPLRGEEKILLVEDNDAMREAVRDVLEGLGYTVRDFATGREAWAALRQNGYRADILASDIVMPEMGGFELYEKLRKKDPQMKAVFMTGYPLQEVDRQFLKSPAVTWLQKPFSADEFASVVRQVLDEAPEDEGLGRQ